jgi:transcription elongation GreA/GreB family factor
VRFKGFLQNTKEIDAQLLLIYNSVRDFPQILHHADTKQQIKTILLEGMDTQAKNLDLVMARKIQSSFLLEDIFPEEFPKASIHLITPIANLESVLQWIEISAFKKRTLMIAREHREDWIPLFLHLFFVVSHTPIRDYIFKELQQNKESKPLVQNKIHDLLHKVTLYPDTFFWYFQKLLTDEPIPFNTSEGRCQFLEALLILLHSVESKPEMRELTKKIYALITAKRYEMVRTFIKDTSVQYLEEFLLLTSKCHTFTKHDLTVLQNLAEVVHPTLSKSKKWKKEEKVEEVLWTTQEGYQKLQERIQHIGTVETLDNAREIEAARSLGDLRENAEYKFALERRTRLQAELRTLSQQLNQARVLTKHDVVADKVDVGSIVYLLDTKGNHLHYTLLGPWDADPDQHILSFQSKLAQAMIGCKAGEKFEFQGEFFTIQGIESFFR